MAEYQINNPEDLIECPYNKAHMIRASRMQYHLMKCRKQHDATEFVACPFNARHEVYRAEARYHQAVCPDRTRIEHALAHANEDSDADLKGCTDLPSYKPKRHQHHGGESWEDDIPSNPRVGVDANLLERRHQYDEPKPKPAANTAGLTALEKRKQYLQGLNDTARAEDQSRDVRRPHGPSQAYAIHMQQQQQQQLLQEQEQQQQQKKSDIYEFVLQQKQNEKLLAAAGRGSTQGSTASLNGSQFTGKPSGVGRGVLGIRPGMPGVLARGDGGVGPVGFASGAPGVAGYSAAGTATAVSTIRGSRPLSSQLVSQPTHSLSLSTGRGQTLSMDTSCNNPRQEVNAYAVNGLGNHAAMGATGGSETEEEGGQFVDTPAWVGGGYHTSPGAPGFFDAGYAMGDAPGSYPRLVPGASSSSSSSSVMASESEASISSSTEEIQKSLKKVRKALRQIDSLENKRSQGIKLNPAEESKVSRKWALETEEAELQNKLEVLSVD